MYVCVEVLLDWRVLCALKCSNVCVIDHSFFFPVFMASLYTSTQPLMSLFSHRPPGLRWQMTPPSACQVLIQLALALIILPMTDYQRGHCLPRRPNERSHHQLGSPLVTISTSAHLSQDLKRREREQRSLWGVIIFSRLIVKRLNERCKQGLYGWVQVKCLNWQLVNAWLSCCGVNGSEVIFHFP